MTYLIFWAIALVIFGVGLRSREEVIQIVAALVGTVAAVWGLAIAPMALQLLIEVSVILAVFSICVRCVGAGE